MREFILRSFTDDEAETCIRCGLQEVVRCKDCKHGRLYNNDHLVACELEELARLPEDFCSNGRRKEE